MLMAVAGALVVIIGLCLCLICICWKRYVSSKKRNIPTSSSAFPLTKFPDMQDDASDAQETSVYGYDEIGEAKMEREISVIQHDIISIQSLNKDTEVTPINSDGYLHPYHSLVSINSNSCKGLGDQHNVDMCEERSYLELSAANQYLELSTGNQCNNEVQQKKTCELVFNKVFSEKDDEIKYEVPKDAKSSGDKVVFF
ncbi:unnamed protein product [Mytilus coruscus]|uniref:Uncharacterized protein n=1 Tax=Mytilus coruscus TaxID=42192 RepID=A0A6J8AYJ7_MYTCO|nr:unnamed protein product [Mytilus coruscus]